MSRGVIEAQRLHVEETSRALAFVDAQLGAATEWLSPIIGYQHSSDFQAGLKEERGHWLLTAARHGVLRCYCGRGGAKRNPHDYLPCLTQLVDDQANRVLKAAPTIVDPNDKRFLKLVQTLAPAMAAHYLLGTGWTDSSWELKSPTSDVDLQVTAADGTLVNFQIKSPDQPGNVVAHRIADGESNENVLNALVEAIPQLPRTRYAPGLAILSPNRTWPLTGDVSFFESVLLGSRHSRSDGVVLPAGERGLFWTPDWKHVSGVVFLDFVRGMTLQGEMNRFYGCVIIANPNAVRPVCPDWFPHARILSLVNSKFMWIGGPPGHTFFPDGTKCEMAAAA